MLNSDELSLALDTLAASCGECDIGLGEECARVHGDRIFLPHSEYLRDLPSRNHTIRAFGEFLCSLRPASFRSKFRSADDKVWVKRKQSRLPSQQITVGKFLRRFMQYVAEFILLPELHGRIEPRRFTLLDADLEYWDWLPPRMRPKDWFRGDICKGQVPSGGAKSRTGDFGSRVQEFIGTRVVDPKRMLCWGFSLALRMIVRDAPGPVLEQRISATLSRVKTIGKWTEDGITVGIHIRRGDACEVWIMEGEEWKDIPPGARMKDYGRPCFATGNYIEKLKIMVRAYNVANVIVMTDGTAIDEILEWASRWASSGELQLAVRWLDIDRKKYGKKNQDPLSWTGDIVEQVFIENRKDMEEDARNDIVAELFAELRMMASADAFIGTATSG